MRWILTLSLMVGVLAANAEVARAQRGPERVMTLDEVLRGSEESRLRWPNAVAAASADQVAVSDVEESRLFFFKRVGISWSLEQVAKCTNPPVDLIWDRDRYVISTRKTGVLYTTSGPGSPIEEIRVGAELRPGAMATLPSGGQLVYDQGSSSVVRIGRNGQTYESVPIDGFVSGLAARQSGGWFAAIADRGEIAVVGTNGKVVDRWNLASLGPVPAWPAGVATGADGRVYVTDRHNGRVLVLDSTGRWIGVGSRKGWDMGLLIRPAGIARLPGNELLVADQGNGRAQIFTLIFEAALP